MIAGRKVQHLKVASLLSTPWGVSNMEIRKLNVNYLLSAEGVGHHMQGWMDLIMVNQVGFSFQFKYRIYFKDFTNIFYILNISHLLAINE